MQSIVWYNLILSQKLSLQNNKLAAQSVCHLIKKKKESVSKSIIRALIYMYFQVCWKRIYGINKKSPPPSPKKKYLCRITRLERKLLMILKICCQCMCSTGAFRLHCNVGWIEGLRYHKKEQKTILFWYSEKGDFFHVNRWTMTRRMPLGADYGVIF